MKNFDKKFLNVIQMILFIFFMALSILMFAAVLVQAGMSVVQATVVTIFLAAVLHKIRNSLPSGISLVTVCGKIAGNITINCDAPMQGGTRDRAWIINFDDVDDIVYNVTNKMIVEEILLKEAKTAYYIDGQQNSIAPNYALIKGALIDQWDHIIKMIGFDISPAVKENLTGMTTGKFLVITENVFRGATGNSAFEVYGISVGLEITILERNPLDADTQGGFNFTFATNKNKAPKMPHSVFDTSYAATKAMIEALVA
jgi:hypothetical protein